jgi:hypothetical protein
MKIGILTAMSVEFRQVAAMLCETESIQHGPQQYLTGTLGRNEIVLLQCGIGKVNAAMGVTDLILPAKIRKEKISIWKRKKEQKQNKNNKETHPYNPSTSLYYHQPQGGHSHSLYTTSQYR